MRVKRAREGEQRINKEVFAPDFDRHPLTEIEAEIELLEKSWADFVSRALINCSVPAKDRLDIVGSLTVAHRVLEVHKQRFIAGDRSFIFTALIWCIQWNVPLPYWLGGAILDINEQLLRKGGNLHKLFGLESTLPAKGKRALTARRDVQLQARLWRAVRALMAKGKSKQAAIEQAIEDLNFPYGPRKSREIFDAMVDLQSGYFDTLRGTKKHLMK